jgi:hypothetical protein
MDPFIKDVSDVETIQDVKMIDYKGKFCMVRLLKKDSSILRMNPNLKYLVRFTPPSTNNKLHTISYIPISEEEYKTGLESYKKIMQKGGKTQKNKKRK